MTKDLEDGYIDCKKNLEIGNLLCKSFEHSGALNMAIVGSRGFNNYEFLKEKILDHFNITKIKTIISGGASGTDTLAEKFADFYHISKNIHYPDWDKYGKSAGIIRNKQIIESADFVFVFWDGNSRGAKNDIDLCKKLNKRYLVIEV